MTEVMSQAIHGEQGLPAANPSVFAGLSGRSSSCPGRGHHDPDEVGGIFRAELLHDVGAMVFDSARADTQMPPGFLVGSAGCELLQHLALPAGQWLAAGEMQRTDVGAGAIGL